ncbi:family 78 glycoside hydrolase catalytic domain [Streptomyces justiciae]|uniref:family 78 glycoside hydrolase catalytic domain n=1 Tax=Streptomyces justiciae TaxID=2780140 RepID=UPI002117BACF|nr:family 78 glycoside hydrolase catalytic domain [Streptomyces justiciae]MCW8383298.1 glycoside hydrolase family 78 protein [Streptomyces justiciae]
MDEDNRTAALSRRHLLGIMTAAAAGGVGAALPLAAASDAVAAVGGGRGSGPANLQVNSRVAPLGTETAPAFSWIPPVGRQSAYEIQVGSAPGASDVWRTGKVTGSVSTGVPYGGGRLRSERAYFWRVRTWDETGEPGAWSEPARWETGLLEGEEDWADARWIGGRVAQDHDWQDQTATVVFRGGPDPTGGLSLLLRAEPIGKTWGEGLNWTVRQTGDAMQLVMRTSHYAGNTWVDDGTSEPDWGVNQYDPQSETNPTTSGTRSVPVGTVDLPASTGLTKDTWATRDHTVVVRVYGLTVTTTVNDVDVDTRTLTGDQIRRHGSFGFAGGTSATVRKVTVTGTGARDFAVDLTTGANPFESGIATLDGLTFPPKNPYIPAKNAVLPVAAPAPVLRRAFTLPRGRRVTRARLHLSAAGNVTFTVNGDPLTVDGRRATGGRTNVPRLLTDQSTYDRTVLYDTFDVTALLRAGRENVVGAELGRGWYGVTTPQEWYWQLAPYAGQPRLRAKLVVTYADGSSTTLVTDRDWLTADGPTTFDSVYSGEKYDARRADELGEWREVGYRPGRDWRAATVLIPPGSCASPAPKHHGPLPATTVPDGFKPAAVRAHEAEPVLVSRTLRPVSITETAPGSGTWVLDYGQILTGLVRLSLTGVRPAREGLTLRMRGGNRIAGGDGTAASPLAVEEENFQHDANLQTHYYTLGRRPTQTWEQQFSHFGFRYLEVTNLERALGRAPDLDRDLDVLTVGVARSGFARTGTFGTDNALLNRLQRNLEWAEQNNLVQKPTDTPSREKNGWTGDAMASSESQSLTWDVNALLTNYLRHFPDNQISTGQLPMIVPVAKGGYGYDRTPGWNAAWKAVPAWDSAYFVIPWELYTYYGNSALFAELYAHQDTLLTYYETLFTAENDYEFEASLGAYSGAEAPGSNAVISLAFYIHFCDYMDKVGRRLGRTERATHYARLARTLRKAFIANYWDEAKGCFTRGSISSENAMAIAFDLVPGSDLDPDDPRHLAGTKTVQENTKALAKLLADRIVAADQHLQNDMYGSRYEFNILSEHGYTDVALKAVTQTGAPGYVYQIAKGATSLWEQWTDRLSVNHHYRSNVATWFYQSLAGIRPTSTAYETLRVRPYIPAAAVNSRVPRDTQDTDLAPAALDHVSASIDTVRGTVSSEWRRRADGRIALTVTVPYNTEAEIWVPAQGGPVSAPRGAHHVRRDTSGGAAYEVYRAQAGSYRFNA